MRLFRSIFMAVIVIVPGLARGADYTVVGNIVRYTGMISDWDFVNADLNTGGRKAFDNHLTEKFCMTTAGNNVTVDQAGIVITCNTIKPESMRPNSLLEEYYYALCRGKCADGGGTYSSGSGTGDGCVCKGIVKPEPIPEYDAEKLERLNALVARQADKSISKDVKQLEQESDKELKKDVNADSRQLDKDIQTEFNDIDESTEKLTDELTGELNRQKFESDMEQAAIDDALISVDEINSESDKELKKDVNADSRQLDKDIQTEFNDIDESTEKLTDELTGELNRQKFESDMEQAAIDDALISVDEINSESDKELQKQLECESKNPPKAAKKNFLGIWVCVDTQETVDARKAARATNKILNAFWNEMEDLERAFNKRVRQLRRDAKRDGGAK